MSLAMGTRIGPYEVTGTLGAGGMGEVYRARDPRLHRDVALKVLPDRFASDPERLARFQREAQALAALKHPNIGVIYGLEESRSTRALVLELIEGDTLADRIARGPIPIDEALPIARQIADALEAAHEQGIIHRDLKPSNIKVAADGALKVLDFGLAKLAGPADAGPSDGAERPAALSQSPTLTVHGATGIGVILGTAAYMAPEQAKGRVADKRSDVWAFGCVLYEILTGRRAFEGDDVSEILASVIKGQPDWSALPAATPAAIARLLRRCLDKDRRERLHDMGDARIDIQDALKMPDQALPQAPVSFSPGRRAVSYAATALFAAALAGVAAWTSRPTPAAPPVRFAMHPNDGWLVPISSPRVRGANTADPALAISPDGQRLAFVASSEGQTLLWIRTLDSLASQPLTGTDGASSPFWSPDGQYLGFFADGALKKIAVSGGAPVTLCEVQNPRGGTWSAGNVIVFGSWGSPLQRVSTSGGVPTAVTTLAAGEAGHNRPSFLPDGRHFLYRGVTRTGSDEDLRGSIFVGALDSSEVSQVLESDAANVQYSQGRLLFLRGTTLMAQSFDVTRLMVTGEPVRIAQEIQTSGGPPIGQFSVSAGGTLAYRSDDAADGGLVWFDRSGTQETTLAGAGGRYAGLDLSPEGDRVAAALRDPVTGTLDIWILDTARALRTRLTFDGADDGNPAWSPDGKLVLFDSTRNGRRQLFLKPGDGSAPEEPLLVNDVGRWGPTWSPDGRYAVFVQDTVDFNSDLFAIAITGERKVFPFVQTPFAEGDARFSPDGRWVAYISDESGRPEVYVSPFPGPGGKRRISTAGGNSPRWRRDGVEIFYAAPDMSLMAAAVNGQGATFEVLSVQRLFALPGNLREARFSVSPDGQRFLVPVGTAGTPITLVVNWVAGLTQ